MPSADLLTLWDSVNALQTQLVRQRTFQSCPGTRENSFRIDFSQKSRSQHGHLRWNRDSQYVEVAILSWGPKTREHFQRQT